MHHEYSLGQEVQRVAFPDIRVEPAACMLEEPSFSSYQVEYNVTASSTTENPSTTPSTNVVEASSLVSVDFD